MPNWTIRADFGSGLIEIDTKHVQKIMRERSIHHNLKTTIDTCTFQVTESSLALSLQTTAVDIPIEIDKDGVAYFRGIVRRNHTRRFSSSLKAMKVEAVDYLYNLQTRITEDFTYSALPISDPTNTSHSFLHQLFARAGIASAKLTFSAVTDQITEIAVGDSDDMSWWELLNNVLWEFGYVVYQEASGNFEVYNLYPSAITFGTLTDATPIYHGAKEERKEFRYQKVRVNYHPIVTKPDVTLWRDTTGQTDNLDCNIALAAGEYYPGDCNLNPAYARYKINDYELIRGANLTLNSTLSGVVVNTFTPAAKRAELCLYSSGGGTITKLNIKGDAVLRDTARTYRAVRIITSGSDNILEHDAEYLDSEAKANRLASGLADWYTDGIYTYHLQSDATIVRGEYYTLDSTTMGITVDTRVVSVKEDQWGEKKIRLEATAPVTITSDASETDFQPAENEPENQNTQSSVQVPTFNNLKAGAKDDGTDLYVAGTVITGEGIKSDNYTVGSQGWAIDGAGDAEFNNVTVRGTIYSTVGEIGGFKITTNSLEDVNGKIVLNSSATRYEIKDSIGTLKTALGYLGGIGTFTASQYGLYIADGNELRLEGGGELVGKDYYVDEDGALVILGPDGTEAVRLGSLAAGDIGIDIGGMKFTDTLGGGDANTTYTETLGGGTAASTYTSTRGGGNAVYGGLGFLYSLDEGLKMYGNAIIDGTIKAPKIDIEDVFAETINFAGKIQSSTNPTLNFWNGASGEFRVGDSDNYLHYDSSGLALRLTSFKIETNITRAKEEFRVSKDGDIDSLTNPLILTTGGTNSAYGSINHAQELRLQTGGVDRVTIDSGGDVAIGSTSPNGYKLYVAGDIRMNSISINGMGERTWIENTNFSGTFYLPSGLWIGRVKSESGAFEVEIKDSAGTWQWVAYKYTSDSYAETMSLISDGENVRFSSSGGKYWFMKVSN